MKEIMVKDILGANVNPEDAIILREMIDNCLESDVVLDFKEVKKISGAFFATLLTELMCKKGRNYVSERLKVKNLTNLKEFNRVLLGTSCC
ncbi:STAS-like domain-containing protein [Clostridium sp. JNZ J1-5]|nr:STAS-like domain-containing protein [Clostridium sp.]